METNLSFFKMLVHYIFFVLICGIAEYEPDMLTDTRIVYVHSERFFPAVHGLDTEFQRARLCAITSLIPSYPLTAFRRLALTQTANDDALSEEI